MKHTHVIIASSLLETTKEVQMWFLYTESCSPKSQVSSYCVQSRTRWPAIGLPNGLALGKTDKGNSQNEMTSLSLL